jgi:hypothetical protein
MTFMDNSAIVSIGLVSGASYQLSALFLCPGDKIAQARALQMQGAKSLGGVSTGIGFWGSPGWAIGGAAALGVVEGVLSEVAGKQGIKQLAEAEQVLQAARREGQYVPIGQINNIELPYPDKWAYSTTRERETGLKLFGPKTETVSCAFIHDGGNFLKAKTAENEVIFIAVAMIETFRLLTVGSRSA